MTIYFENLTVELHFFYVLNTHIKFRVNLNTHIKFRVNQMLFTIRFINLFFIHKFILQKFEI